MERLRATVSINFYNRQSKKGKDGLAPIEMGVNINGQRFFVNLPRKFSPDTFERELGKKNSTLKEYLDAVEGSIRSYETKCLTKGIKLCTGGMKEFIRNGFSMPAENIGYALDGFYRYVDSKDIGDAIKKKYRLILGNFLEQSGLTRESVLEELTPGKCREFVNWLKKTYLNSTYTGMYCRFKAFMTYCVENRLIEKNPCFGIKVKKEETKVETITENEYKRIKELDLSWSKRLEKVRDLFIFSCGTGLAYTDTQKLATEDFQTNDRGQVYLSKKRAKTGVNYTVVVLPDALSIAKRYNYKLPTISNQKLNSTLKAIQDLAGIKTNITFHKARHFYACMLLNKFHFSLEIVARALGHSSTKQSSHYAKLFSSTVFDQFERISI